MPKKGENNKLENFKVEKVFEGRVHERYAFTFKVQGVEFKGYFHEDEIQWLHPHPNQLIGASQLVTIESTIYELMEKYGISSGIKDLKVEKAFEGRIYERQQFTLQVQGKEYKGFVHEGEIQWFHPQPQQNLEDDHIDTIESEIHEKISKQ